ncbi:MAG: glycogen debranching N-terminal domain-containing protein [Acidimicrobiia bacterium]
MTDPAQSWSEVGRVPAVLRGGIATIADRAFCYSGRSGNLAGTGPQGFFYDDTRFLSKFHLLVNQTEPEVVDTALIRADEALFQLRSRVAGEVQHPEPTLLVSRHRYQSNTLHEDVLVENRSGAPTSVTVELILGADFAALLDVRLAGSGEGRLVKASKVNEAMRFSYHSGSVELATWVSTSYPGDIDGDTIRFSLSLDEGELWKTCVDVVPQAAGEVMPVGRTCTTRGPERHPFTIPTWLADAPRLRSSADTLEHLWAQSMDDLAALEFSLEGRRAFAAGIPWFVALFGRDSIISAIQTMLLGLGASLETAELLAHLQGREVNPAISEEPGKILHEARFGEHSSIMARKTRFYGAVDATPLFCMLLGELWDWGCSPDRLKNLLPAMRAAVGWIEHRLEVGDGLLTYESDATQVNQSWKDSPDSVVDSSGHLLDPPIAMIEVQGYAVAALGAAARLEAGLGRFSREAPHRALADELQQRIEERFWLDDLETFAMALGGDGHMADTLSSNPGHLLWAEAVRPERAVAVAQTLVGEELWSGWGVRTLSAKNPAFNPISYHRGSVWPHDNMLCIAGLFNYGHTDQALTVVGGLLAAASHFSYQLPELFSGFDREEVHYPVAYPTSSAPQAWAAGVPVHLVQLLLGIRPQISDRGVLVVSPRLPDGIDLRLEGVRVGEGMLSVRAEGGTAQLLEVPKGLDIVVR